MIKNLLQLIYISLKFLITTILLIVISNNNIFDIFFIIGINSNKSNKSLNS